MAQNDAIDNSPHGTIRHSAKPLSLLTRYHIPLKLHYFFFFAGSGALYPILSITLGHRGLSNLEISCMSLIVPFLGFITNPCVGFIADRSRRVCLTFNAVLSFATTFYIMFFLMPSIKSHRIQAEMRRSQTLGRVLDVRTSDNVATTCASKIQCGCLYQAECTSLTTVTVVNESKHFNVLDFNFTMNPTDRGREKSNCGFHYEVPIENALVKRLDNQTIGRKR